MKKNNNFEIIPKPEREEYNEYISVSIPTMVLRKLEKSAKNKNKARTQLIREILMNWFEKQ